MSKSAPTEMAEVASPALDKRIEESIVKAIPVILAKFLSSGGLVPSQEPSSKSVASNSSCSQTDEENPETSNRGEHFYATEEDVELSSELLDLTTKAFTIVRWLNDRIVTRVIKAWNLAHSLLIPCQMILEGVPMTVCSCVRFKEMFSFKRNQELGSLWYDFKYSHITTI